MDQTKLSPLSQNRSLFCPVDGITYQESCGDLEVTSNVLYLSPCCLVYFQSDNFLFSGSLKTS